MTESARHKCHWQQERCFVHLLAVWIKGSPRAETERRGLFLTCDAYHSAADLSTTCLESVSWKFLRRRVL